MQLNVDDVLALAPIALEHLPVDSALRARIAEARYVALAKALCVDVVHLSILRALEAVSFADRVRASSGEDVTPSPLRDCDQLRDLSSLKLVSTHSIGPMIGWFITELGSEFLRRVGEACPRPCGQSECGDAGGYCRRGRPR